MTWVTVIYYECLGFSGKKFSGVIFKKGEMPDDPIEHFIEAEKEIMASGNVGVQPIDEILKLETKSRLI